MERTKPNVLNFPDMANFSLTKNFTQVPNALLRNPKITAKAKAVLCILLSNKEGWSSHILGLRAIMKEKEAAIQSALRELESVGYLARIQIRNKKTKQRIGSFWAYCDIPYSFDIGNRKKELDKKGFELYVGFLDIEKLNLGFLDIENPPYNNTNSNNTNSNNTNSSSDNGFITKSQFDDFWELYPKKADKGKALSKWNTICNRKPKDRPKWRDVKRAVLQQKNTERWQDGFIPMPTTWLNNSRWMDDPKEMKRQTRASEGKPKGPKTGTRQTNFNSPRKDER